MIQDSLWCKLDISKQTIGLIEFSHPNVIDYLKVEKSRKQIEIEPALEHR